MTQRKRLKKRDLRRVELHANVAKLARRRPRGPVSR
jgi:hypothetical protein